MIGLRLERDRFRPSDVVTGAVVTSAHLESRAVELTISMRERTADFEEPVLVGGGLLHQGALVPGADVPFALQLPHDALPPYRSRWGELFWEVEAKADMPSAHDLRARHRIEVIPSGIEDWQLAGEDADEFKRLLPAKLAEWAAAPDLLGFRPATAPGPDAPRPQHPAGWYDDPWKQKRVRFWDGHTWTGQTAD